MVIYFRRVPVVCLLGLLSLTACGWVDETGRQNNTAPDIALDGSNLLVEDSEQAWSLRTFDEDGNVSSLHFKFLDSGSAVTGCLSEISPLVVASTLREACQPHLTDEQCQVQFDVGPRDLRVTLPELRQPAALSYEVQVIDEDGASDTSLMDFCIATVSEAPEAEDDLDYRVTYLSTLEHSGTSYDALCQNLGGTGVLANDSDDFDYSEGWSSGAGCLRAELIDGPTYATKFELRTDGGFSYQSSGAAGPGTKDTFTYRISDGLNVSDIAAVTVLITGDNEPPIALNPSLETLEDQVLEIGAQALASDPEGAALRIESFEQPTHGELVLVDDRLRFVPSNNYHGADSFAVTVVDASGLQVVALVSVVVNQVNDKPVVTGFPEVFSIDVDSSSPSEFEWTFVVDDEESSSSSLFIASQIDSDIVEHRLQGPTAEGVVTLYLTPFQDGNATLNFQVVDEALGALPAQRTELSVPVIVTGVNKAPIAVDDEIELLKKSTKTVPVLENDSDPDGAFDGLRVVAILQGPVNGTVAIVDNGRALQIQSESSFANVDEVHYQIEDADGATAAGVVVVNTINRAPIVVNESYNIWSGSTSLFDVLNNDSDPDGDKLTLVLARESVQGQATLLNGKISYYQPPVYNSRTVNIPYEVHDGDGGVSVGNVNLTINGDGSGR